VRGLSDEAWGDGKPWEEGEGFYKTLLDHLSDGVYFVDRERRVAYWNQGAERITGYRAEEVVGRACGCNLLGHVDEQGTALCLGECALSRAMDHGDPEAVEAFLQHREGHRVAVHIRVVPIRDAAGRVVGAVEIFSEDGRRVEGRRRIAELEQLAYVDVLTELASRRFSEISLGLSLDQWSRYGWSFGLVLLDVDDFKEVNDTFGHLVGDRVLQMVARTLRATSRPSDVVGRWGGDEFLALLQNVDGQELDQVARKYGALVRSSSLVEGARTVGVTISTGVALVERDDTAESLIARADEALYAAKRLKGRAGRNGEKRYGFSGAQAQIPDP